MAKDNMLLGFARGKVGDLVFYRHLGNQVTRARNASPANPRTARQGVQRSILKTVSQFYAMISGIADHSFEGVQAGAEGQAAFQSANVRLLREKVLNSNVNLSDPASILSATIYNFSTKDNAYPLYNPYVISQGSLGSIEYDWGANLPVIKYQGAALPSEPTYQEFINAFGLSRGDQLTFVWFYGNDETLSEAGKFTSWEISRLILDPANGSMTTKLWTGGEAGGSPFEIGSPNQANTGRIFLDSTNQGEISFAPASSALGSVGDNPCGVACAVILSRRVGSSWKRSTQIVKGRTGLDNSLLSWNLGDAAASFMDAGTSSPLYLNQATD